MDGDKTISTPPKVKILMKDVTKLMNDAIAKDYLKDIKEEILVIKQSNTDAVSKAQNIESN